MDIQINGDTRIETIILNEIADIDLQIFRKGTARNCVKLPFEIITKLKGGRIGNEPKIL